MFPQTVYSDLLLGMCGKYALDNNRVSVLMSLGRYLIRRNSWSLLNLAVTWNMISLGPNSFITNSTRISTCPMIIKEFGGKYNEISDSVPFYQSFLSHIWVGISKDLENSKQAEPETCRKKCIDAVLGRKISLYYFKKQMSHPK